MILNIQELEPLTEISLDMESEACQLASEIATVTTPIHLDTSIRKVREEITIRGHISARIEMICARCLQPHTEACDETFEVIYHPKPADENLEAEIELEAEDLKICFYEGTSLSLAELVRQQLLLMIPMKPLCKPDCAGLCQVCGKDLNEGDCHCSHETIDPRLAVLQQFFTTKVSAS